MKFTLIALNGTELTVDSDMLATLPSVTYLGGLKTSAGYIRDVSNYTGVLVTVLADWVGGLDNGTSLYVTAVDGYSMVFSYTQITGDFVTFDPVTGDEVEHKEPLYMVLAYLKNGEPLPEGEGPLRLMVLGPEGLVTEGHNWVKLVNIVEIRPATREWTLTLDGFLTEEVDRATFESGVNCHSANWTDSEGKTWTGIPLWLLVGRVDDGNVHETNDTYKAFNRTLADIGYRVRLTATDGYKVELNSSFVKLNNGIIVASLLDGKVLPDPYWPLKLVGPSLPKNQMIASIVKIEVIFGNDWNITLKGALTELMTRDIFDEGTDCHQANWTDSENRTWTGIPLWLLVGRVDDALQHGENAFNRTLADQGYIVRIRAADGFTVDFNSTELKLNDNIIIANMMNGMPLPEKYWPLRSVGPSLTKKQMVNNIVEIEIIFPS